MAGMPDDNRILIQPFRNTLLKWLTQSAPWLMLGVILFLLWPANIPKKAGEIMFSTGFLAATLAIFVFQIVMGKISETFHTLWRRGILHPLDQETKIQQDMPAELLSTLEDQLNDTMQWAIAGIFLVLPLSWYIGREKITILILPEMLISFIIGLYAWRMVVLGLKIWQLPRQFTLVPHFDDPDNCGGLEPVGNLCLWNALITAIPSLYLSLWIAIGAGMQKESLSGYQAIAISYTPLFQLLLIIPVFFSFIAFILPLYSIHRVMALKKSEVLTRRDELAQKINQAEQGLLELVKNMTDPSEIEKKIKEIELMRTVYTRNQTIPEWPLNLNLIAKFSASQVVPVLTLLGMNKAISDVISTFLSNYPPSL